MAKRLYEQAAKQGYAFAMFDLGSSNGEGVEQSYKRAKKYYEQSAHFGHADAQVNLSILNYKRQGVERDDEKAREWWMMAAAQGQDGAIKYLKLLDKNEAYQINISTSFCEEAKEHKDTASN